MGGQACVFYGAAQVSKDVDFLILADEANFKNLHLALEILAAKRIAVPVFDPAVLERGHAVHFRCSAPGVEGLRIDVMSRLRDLSSFDQLWERRTVIGDGWEPAGFMDGARRRGPGGTGKRSRLLGAAETGNGRFSPRTEGK